MNESGKASRAIYIVPVIYVLGMYMMPVLFWIICNMQESTDSFDAGWIMVMPIVLGLINLAVVLILGKRISRVQLLICTRIIKYALIPFYVVGGFCIIVALLLMFTPVVVMIFVGPTVAIVLSAIGWLGLLGAAPFFNWLYYKGMQRGSTRKGAVCICGHIPVLFHAGCNFCDRTGGEG